MGAEISVETFRGGLVMVLEELFEQVRGYVLDPGTSLFETLATISAEEASRPVSPQSATLAAQVNHLCVHLESLVPGLSSRGAERPDWPASWRVDSVTDEEWSELIARLRTGYDAIRQFAETYEDWNVMFVGGAFALVAHTAYHLGEIRQGIGVLRQTETSGAVSVEA